MIFHSTYRKPILLIGNGARAAGAADLIIEFCKKTEIPVLTTMNAVDIAQDEFHIGFIGMHGNRVANMILEESDCIISVGARLGIRQVGCHSENFAPKAHLIRCDIDEYELSRKIKKDEERYNSDAYSFMTQLINENIPNYKEWRGKCLEVKMLLADYDKVEGNLAVEKISSLLPKNPIVSVDVGQHQCWAAQSLHLQGTTGRIHIGGGYGAMGWALPCAIGASISTNNGTVFCIIGDGGLQMNIQELETVKRENLPLKIFILNNKVLGKISEIQHNNHNKRYAQTTESSGYTVPDFQKISEAYGIKAATLSSYNELDNYASWLENKQPCLLNIMLPEDSFLIPKIRWENGKIEPVLKEEVAVKAKAILEN